MKKLATIAVSFIVVFCIPGLATADTNKCPRVLATIEGDPLSSAAVPVFEDLYSDLGCDVNVTLFPGRRGVNAFNKGHVDGELFRAELIEPSYKRPFVKSTHPVMTIVSGIWGMPAHDNLPYGFTIGIQWMEDYAAQTGKHRFKRYQSETDMIQDYQQGKLSGFLSENATIDVLIKRGTLKDRPLLVEEIGTLHLFHYLAAEYSAFMSRLSKELETDGTHFKKLLP